MAGGTRVNSKDALVTIRSIVLVVNDLDLAGGFYQSLLGLSQLSRDGETMTLGAGPRSADSTGLAEVVVTSDGTVLPQGELIDPWGTRFTVVTG